MIDFELKNPFPLLESYSYEAAKKHAALVDNWLGFKIQNVESTFSRDLQTEHQQELWIGLDPQAMLTPYLEIRTMLDWVQPIEGDTIAELGAGYARMAHVIKAHYPNVFYKGYEYVEARVIEARRVLGEDSFCEIIHADLTDDLFQLPKASVYFIYDFGSQSGIRKILKSLQSLARSHAFKVIGRGRATRQIIEREEPWLSQVVPPRHHSQFSVYFTHQ